MNLPKSPACERNKDVILEKLKEYSPLGDVLEIGHGTGQHAIHFSKNLDSNWYPADLEDNNWMMLERLKQANQSNLHPPLKFEVGVAPIEKQIDQTFDSIFSANTFHIMAERYAIELCQNLHQLMNPGARFFLYGPFKFEGQFTSASNESFDTQLKSNHPDMGIRDFETICEHLKANNIHFKDRHDLPANNHLLVFTYEA